MTPLEQDPRYKWDEKFNVFRRREVVRLPNGTTERVRASGDTRIACERAFNVKVKRLEAGAPLHRRTGTKMFETFAGEFLRKYPAIAKLRETAERTMRYHVEKRLLPYFAALQRKPITLGEINAKVLDGLIADLSSTPKRDQRKDEEAIAAKPPKTLSDQTVKNILQTLRRMLKFAKRWGEISELPDVPAVKVDDAKDFRFFQFDELDRLFAAITEPDDLDLVMMAARTGLRAGELLGAQWDKVDLIKREIRVDQQLASTGTRLVPVKTKNGKRTVPLPDGLVARLKARRGVKGFVFVKADGSPFTRSDLARKIDRWCRKAGLTAMHWHGLRHTYCSHLVMRGVNLKQVQVWAGHANIQTTMIYSHLAPGVGADLVNRLEEPAPPARAVS